MKKKTALITGGATGLGKATAFQLAEKGYQLVINYRNSESEAIAFVEKLNHSFGTQNFAVKGDVSNADDCNRIVEEAIG